MPHSSTPTLLLARRGAMPARMAGIGPRWGDFRRAGRPNSRAGAGDVAGMIDRRIREGIRGPLLLYACHLRPVNGFLSSLLIRGVLRILTSDHLLLESAMAFQRVSLPELNLFRTPAQWNQFLGTFSHCWVAENPLCIDFRGCGFLSSEGVVWDSTF